MYNMFSGGLKERPSNGQLLLALRLKSVKVTVTLHSCSLQDSRRIAVSPRRYADALISEVM